jgi:hypothetical protein
MQGGFFLLPVTSRLALGPHRLLVGTDVLISGVKKSGREVNHTSLSNASVRMREDVPPLSRTSAWRGF